jgi:hypothetical protein
MGGSNPLLIISIWIAVGTWAAFDGHPGVLILFLGYILLLFFPFAVVWLWEKIKKKLGR